MCMQHVCVVLHACIVCCLRACADGVVIVVVWVVNQLKSGDSAVIIRTVRSLKESVPTPDVIKSLLILLTSPTTEVSLTVGR